MRQTQRLLFGIGVLAALAFIGSIIWQIVHLPGGVWVADTPTTRAYSRTKYLISKAESAPLGEIPVEFQTEDVNVPCFIALQSALRSQTAPPKLSVTENGTMHDRDDDLISTISFSDNTSIKLLFLADGIVGCKSQ